MHGKAKPTFVEERKKLAFTSLTEAIANHDFVKIDGYYEIGKYELLFGSGIYIFVQNLRRFLQYDTK
jgi:hypothetical protein